MSHDTGKLLTQFEITLIILYLNHLLACLLYGTAALEELSLSSNQFYLHLFSTKGRVMGDNSIASYP